MSPLISTILVLAAILGFSGLKVDREYERGVIFRLGRLKGLRGPGMYWVMPILEQKSQG
jgi:regulator of protease activity HflC (stomatin/prohibitin superfamily)